MLNTPKDEEPFAGATISERASLLTALQAIENGGYSLAFVVGEGGKYLGVVDDAAVRGALLSGHGVDSLVTTIVKRRGPYLSEHSREVEIVELFESSGLNCLPVLDAAGSLVALRNFGEKLGPRSRANCAVVMAGGKGVRLRPLTDNLPKPMIRIAGKPILERLILQMVGSGIQKVYVAVNFHGEVIMKHLGDGSRLGCEIIYIQEKEFLGTGGALRLLPDEMEEPILVTNGDLVTQPDFGDLLDFHDRQENECTIGMVTYSHTIPFGCLELEAGRVTGIDEKPEIVRKVSAGIYVLDPKLLTYVEEGYYPITNLINASIRDNRRVAAFEISSEWADVGTREELMKCLYGGSR